MATIALQRMAGYTPQNIGSAETLVGSLCFSIEGAGREALHLERELNAAVAHISDTITQETLERKFRDLALTWKIETLLTSSLDVKYANPAYQRIIGLGPDVIPYILRELAVRPNYWFWALEALTGVNPVRSENEGATKEMARDWIEWGKLHGYGTVL